MNVKKLRLRPILFWSHLVCGIAAGLIILFLSLTGSILACEKPILAWADAHTMGELQPSGQPLPISVLMSRVQNEAGQPAGSVTIPAGDNHPYLFEVGRDHAWLADPYRGKTVAASPHLRGFFHTVLTLHRWFGLSDASHKITSQIVGWAALLFAFLILSGWVLWLPPSWQPAALRTRLRPMWPSQARARNWNWHASFGFWMALPLLSISITGVIMALPWANELLFRITGSPLPQQRGEAGPEMHGSQRTQGKIHAQHPEPGLRQNAHLQDAAVDVDRALAAARKIAAGYTSMQMRIPNSASDSVTITVDRGNGAQPQYRETHTFDAAGKLQRTESFASQSPGRRVRSIVRFLHTGEIFGIAGELLGFVACLASCLLVWTGFALTLQRFRRRKPARAVKLA